MGPPVEETVIDVRVRGWFVVRGVLAVVVAAGLAVDAYVHFNLASTYDAVKSGSVSQGELFRVEGSVAAVTAVAVILRPRRYTALFALLVAAGGLAAVLVYRYVNVGTLGPLPNMYEPVWYAKKAQSAWSEGAAALAALALFFILPAGPRTGRASGVVDGARTR
jgi:hypothetical protein